MQLIRNFIRERISIEDRGHSTPCWVWGRVTRNGYGRADLAGRTVQAHRLSYEAHNGAIPEGMELDHLCRVPACVNPDHLEPVTRTENLHRKAIYHGHTIGGKNRARRPGVGRGGCQRLATHCVNGHEYTPENTGRRRDGRRRCKTCVTLAAPLKNLRRRERRAAARNYWPGEGGRFDKRRPVTRTNQRHGSHDHDGHAIR
jgi:hypothetical protein